MLSVAAAIELAALHALDQILRGLLALSPRAHGDSSIARFPGASWWPVPRTSARQSRHRLVVTAPPQFAIW